MCRAVKSGIFQGSELLTASLRTWAGGLNLAGTLGKFGNDNKLCGMIDILEGRDAIQRHMDRLDKWDHLKPKKFNKTKYRVLHNGWGILLGGGWIERSPEEKALVLLVDQ